MQTQTLLSAFEVLYFTQHAYNLSPAEVTKQIYLQEVLAVESVIGPDFYALLLADVIDYAGTPAWVSGTTYYAGDLVVRLGMVYEATVTTTQDPNGGTDWTLAPKFDADCYNELWIRGLAWYLSCLVLSGAINLHANRIAPGGVVNLEGTDARAVQEKAVSGVVNKLQNDAVAYMRVLTAWAVRANKDGESCAGVFDLFWPVKNARCDADGIARQNLTSYDYLIVGNNGIINPNGRL